ncbi:MAG: Gfo/Idh/MocA family oxidoreductase [Pirellulaceae bacterium]|nr:Gfo/Idh/MocA family oxidoreductase [Pirellulaceae bacterium]
MSSKSTPNRRHLISAAAGLTLTGLATNASVPYFFTASPLAAQDSLAASDKLTLGVIGIGPRCTYDLKSILPFADVRCVAIADVQQTRRDAGKQLVDRHYGNDDCQLYSDFRQLLARDDIDTVLIATGDRWHAAAAMLAAQAGKDVYCEKPCGITIADCQAIESVFADTGRIFQAGTQRRSVANFATAVDLARTGQLGQLQELQATVYVPTLDNTWLPAQPTPDPEHCDWNLWLGPAPWRPYNEKYVAGGWRGQYDFDSGARLLDWGAHTVDLCQWANQADETLPIEYIPSDTQITCRYANGVKLVIDFLEQPFGDRGPRWVTRLGTCPVRFIGDEGSVETGDAGELLASAPTLQQELSKAKRVQGLDVTEHARNFFDSVRSRQKTICNPSVMRHSHIACHAAALSWILKRPLTIDPKTERFVNDDEANRLCKRPARDWA